MLKCSLNIACHNHPVFLVKRLKIKKSFENNQKDFVCATANLSKAFIVIRNILFKVTDRMLGILNLGNTIHSVHNLAHYVRNFEQNNRKF